MSMHEFLELSGENITEADLSSQYAIDFYKALLDCGFSTPIGCKKTDSADLIIFETEVQRPQKTVNDILYRERLAVCFLKDGRLPIVYALRDNFPNVPHVNLTEKEFPRSLCIYEESFDELKLKWTGFKFLEDIRYWLAMTAIGKLHSGDQPLEFLLLPNSRILIINIEDLWDIRTSKPRPYTISSVTSENGRETLFLQKPQAVSTDLFTVCILIGDPQTHGIIKRTPQSLYDLHEFTKNANIDLISELKSLIRLWKDDNDLKGIERSKLIIIIALPKKRNENSDPEQFEVIAFKLNETLKVIGEELGMWEILDGQIGYLFENDDSKNGSSIFGELLNPIYSFSKEIAQGTTGL